MFGRTYTLFKMFGFPIRIDLSWLIIVILVVWSLAGVAFPQWYPGLSSWIYLLMGIGAASGLFASILFHEVSHSLVARHYGLPMKGITLFIFGGVSEMPDEPPSAKAEFLMALAGPMSSFAIAGLCLWAASISQSAQAPREVVGVLGWLGVTNVVLGGFNLIPAFPLDGGRLLRAAIWYFKNDVLSATYVASIVGSGFGIFLIGLGVLLLLHQQALSGLWSIMIGFFLRSAAHQSYRQVVIRQALEGVTVRRFMNPEPVSVPPEESLAHLVEDYIYKYHFKMFPVVADGQLTGCVSTRQVREVPRQEWGSRTVGQVAAQCAPENTVGPDEPATRALLKMQRGQVTRLLVVEDGKLIGVLTLKDLLHFLATKLEMEGAKTTGLPPDADLES